MKTYFFFLIFYVCLSSFAQETRKLTLEIDFSPKASFKSSQFPYEFSSELIHDYEKPKLDLVTGLIINYYITEKITLSSGITYTQRGYKLITKYDPIFIDQMQDAKLKEFPYKVESKYSFEYIDLPLNLIYSFFKKNNYVFYINTGLIYNRFINVYSKHKEYYNDSIEKRKVDEENYDQRKNNLSLDFGIGLLYKISDRLHFRLEPSIDYMIFDHYVDLESSIHFYDFGIQLKTGYRF